MSKADTAAVETDDGTTADSARDLARDKARQLRSNQRKRERRNRWLLRGGIGVGIVVALAVVAVVLVTSIRPAQPGPANMASDGILISKGLKAVPSAGVPVGGHPIANPPSTDGTVNIVEYIDYLSGFSGQFERTNNEQIGDLVKSGAATVEIHPIPVLITGSGSTKYSLRASNAAGCVANYSPDSFWAFNDQMFRQQPAEGSAGLDDAKLKSIVKGVGARHLHDIARCIDRQRYSDWAQDALTRAEHAPIPGAKGVKLSAPLVLVDGKQYTGALTNADDFRAFIVQAQSAAYATTAATAPATPAPAPQGATVGTTTTTSPKP